MFQKEETNTIPVWCNFINKEEVTAARKAKGALESPQVLRPYFEYFKAEMAYFKIRLALSIMDKEE